MKKWQASKYTLLLALAITITNPIPVSASPIEDCVDDICTVSFSYTGVVQSYTFPSNAVNLSFEAFGAQGGKSGGGGGKVTGYFTIIPSQIFVAVGGAGITGSLAPGGFNGGGMAGSSSGLEGSGGGATDIRLGQGSDSRILVAGGGGGRGAGLGSAGGGGGGLIAADGKTGQGSGGKGGTQLQAGLGGAANGSGTAGTSGNFGNGGAGGMGSLHGGGGGGGGYLGGGGGGSDTDSCCTDAGGGGGGSSFTDPSYIDGVIHSQGVRPGNGYLLLSFQLLNQTPDSPEAEPGLDAPAPPPSEGSVTDVGTSGPDESGTGSAGTDSSDAGTAGPDGSDSETSGPPPSEQSASQSPEQPSGTDSPVPTESSDPQDQAPQTPIESEPSGGSVENAPEESALNLIEDQNPAPTSFVNDEAELDVGSDSKSSEATIVSPATDVGSESVQTPEAGSKNSTEAVGGFVAPRNQAAQRITVPVQNGQPTGELQGWVSLLLIAGVFALVAGIALTRKVVPGSLIS